MDYEMLRQIYASRHLTGSHPDYAEMNRIQMMLCYAYNPHLAVHDPAELDVDPVLVPALIDTLETAQGELMDDGNFKDFEAAFTR